MTFIGFAVIAAMVAVLGFAGIKLAPVYLEHMKVKRVLDDVKTRLDGQNPTPQTIRSALDKQFNIEMIYELKSREIFDIQKSDGGFTVVAAYEKPVDFIANVSLLVTFDDEVEIRL
jgi:hypothetical protein